MIRSSSSPSPHVQRGLAVGALVLVTAIWGSTFVIIKGAIDSIDPSDFLLIRFLIATLLLMPFVWRGLRHSSRSAVLAGLATGGVYGAAQLLQTWGLADTAASVSGFLTSAYVVLTPFVAAAATRARIAGKTMLAAVIAMIGIGVLSLTGLALGAGETLTLVSAVIYALHIVLVGRFAQDIPPLTFAALQMAGVTAVVALAALRDGIQLPPGSGAWAAVLYTAVFASIGVLFLQSWAQQHLGPATAAVIMALEPIFATAFAIGFGGESVTARLLIGGSLIFAAILLATIGGSERPEADPEGRHEPDQENERTPPGSPRTSVPTAHGR